MADKKLNEVTKVTDMAYVPVIMADGSIGQIAKADLASVVAEQIRYNVLKKTVNLTEEAIAIAPVETYSSYLLSIKYSDQSSLFFVGFWNVIVVTKELANNLKNIEVNLGIGNNSIYIRSTSGTKQNLSYSLIQL